MYDMLVTLEGNNGLRYNFTAMSEWSDETILEKASLFYHINMVRIVSKQTLK